MAQKPILLLDWFSIVTKQLKLETNRRNNCVDSTQSWPISHHTMTNLLIGREDLITLSINTTSRPRYLLFDWPVYTDQALQNPHGVRYGLLCVLYFGAEDGAISCEPYMEISVYGASIPTPIPLDCRFFASSCHSKLLTPIHCSFWSKIVIVPVAWDTFSGWQISVVLVVC